MLLPVTHNIDRLYASKEQLALDLAQFFKARNAASG